MPASQVETVAGGKARNWLAVLCKRIRATSAWIFTFLPTCWCTYSFLRLRGIHHASIYRQFYTLIFCAVQEFPADLRTRNQNHRSLQSPLETSNEYQGDVQMRSFVQCGRVCGYASKLRMFKSFHAYMWKVRWYVEGFAKSNSGRNYI